MKRFFLLFAFSFLISVSSLCADDAKPEFRHTIFNGTNLDGWHVTGCEVEVKDGTLLLKDGNGLVRTDHRYGDFVLELKYKALKSEAWDSGIYIRCELPPEGKPFPAKNQINLKQGDEGNLIGMPKARSKGLVKAGEWNHFKVTVVGENVEMEINGQHAWKTDGFQSKTGYVGLQVEVPMGGQFEFKDIVITELGYRSLFNGKDLTGWEGASADASTCWIVEDGLIQCTGKKGTWLRSSEEFGNFNLRFEYKLKAGGNSGVYIRVPKDGNHHGPASGIEVQVLDDNAERYTKLQPYQYCGSLYAIAPSTLRVCKPAETWNTMEINCRDKQYRVIHNGVVIINASVESFPKLDERRVAGFLGLQNHSEQVWFRNIRISQPVIE